MSEPDLKAACVCVCFQKAENDPEEIRREMELQLEAWHKLPPGSQEEVSLTPVCCSAPYQRPEILSHRTRIRCFKYPISK